MKRVLTGITTTGSPHIGNYVGAIRPAIQASHKAGTESFYFLADYHALVKTGDAERVQRSTLEIAATWLALGLDPDKVFFYRQSDIPEIPELTWLLTCVTAKGLLNRAHAYKASVDANVAAGEDPDAGITAGLYMYPVLMAADILVFNAHAVPVGRDQIQHIEMARDIGQRFNHLYRHEYFTLPEAQIDESTAILPGLDGRKMSKSYDNTIPLWDEPKALRKKIMGIVTNSLAPGEAKDPEGSALFTIYQAFASAEETEALRKDYAAGIAWGEAKERLAARIDAELAAPRERYRSLVDAPQKIEQLLLEGAAKARARATPFLRELRAAAGLRPLAAQAAVGSTKSRATVQRALRLVPVRNPDGSWAFKLDGFSIPKLQLFRDGFPSMEAARDAGQALLAASPLAFAIDIDPGGAKTVALGGATVAEVRGWTPEQREEVDTSILAGLHDFHQMRT